MSQVLWPTLIYKRIFSSFVIILIRSSTTALSAANVANMKNLKDFEDIHILLCKLINSKYKERDILMYKIHIRDTRFLMSFLCIILIVTFFSTVDYIVSEIFSTQEMLTYHDAQSHLMYKHVSRNDTPLKSETVWHIRITIIKI